MLSAHELDRYRRQILLFGEDGQERLKSATIFIAGAGGLGCPVALYLAAAGVGTITIVDNDVVEKTNLNRQILHYDRDIGKKKVKSADEKLREINSDITVNAVDATIGKSNVSRLVGKASGIVDAMDNFPARYLLNKTALKKKIPLFHGAVRGLYGQATTIISGKTPCLSCIFPHAPPKETVPIIGATAGFIAMVQATEVIKFHINEGDLLTNRLLIWDGRVSRAEEIVVEKNPACRVCCTTKTKSEDGANP
jgi:adenylyltransferase/sulfurtransferase